MGPSKLAGSVKDAFGSPLTSALAAIAVGAVLAALVWLVFRMVSGRKPGRRTWPYVQLPGSERLELLRAFRQVEKMLKKRGVQPRRPGQTLQEYAREASRLVTGAEAELAWFTEAARSAAYDPNWGKDDIGRQAVQEARGPPNIAEAGPGLNALTPTLSVRERKPKFLPP